MRAVADELDPRCLIVTAMVDGRGKVTEVLAMATHRQLVVVAADLAFRAAVAERAVTVTQRGAVDHVLGLRRP